MGKPVKPIKDIIDNIKEKLEGKDLSNESLLKVESLLKEGKEVTIEVIKNEKTKSYKRNGKKVINEVIGKICFCINCKKSVTMINAYLVSWSAGRYIIGSCENCETEIMTREK